MTNNPNALLEAAGITLPPIAVYNVPDTNPFEPFAEPTQCIFGNYSNWLNGESTVINAEKAPLYECPGAGYWLCGISTMPVEATAEYLAGIEGLKASIDVMRQWLEKTPSNRPENGSIVITRLKGDHYEHLKTVTFFVNPDQLALLLTGAEYLNTDPNQMTVIAPYGSGCGQMITMLNNLDEPLAMIGATDVATRKHLPPDTLAFTVTKPMFEQLCELDENSFLYKTFWNDLRRARA